MEGGGSRGLERTPPPLLRLETSRGAISILGIDSILEALGVVS